MRAQARELWVWAENAGPADVAGVGAMRRDFTVSKGDVTAVVTTPAIMLDLNVEGYRLEQQKGGDTPGDFHLI